MNSDIRLIVHRTDSSLLLCYVGHHDDAYRWAERRKLETHPKTGAAQFVEVRETVQEIKVAQYVESQAARATPRLFESTPDEIILECGVPPEWLNDVRNADEDSLLDLADHLPAEAAEALLEIATGGVSLRRRLAHLLGRQPDILAESRAEALPAEESITPGAISGPSTVDAALRERLAMLLGRELHEIQEKDIAEGQTKEDAVPRTIPSLPQEVGGSSAELIPVGTDPFQHPDSQRRFRLISNAEELERALEFPWEKWTVFLHPIQRSLVERDYSGPARVSGSAGTGKTIVALHRAVFLARENPETRVLLATFSDALANALRTKLRRLIGNEPRLGERVEVHSMNAIGRWLYELNVGRAQIASREAVRDLVKDTSAALGGSKFSQHFLLTEWEQVADAWQLDSWEAYRDVARLGRKTRLQGKQRTVLWSVFDQVRAGLRKRGLITYPQLFTQLASKLREGTHPPFDFAVIDEAQDVSVAQLRFLAALGAKRPNGLFFAGDLGQRIFQQPFSWRALGVDVRGRSFTLKVNYRTSHRIRSQADRLLAPELWDVDGITEKRTGTTSTFDGPPPEIQVFDTAEDGIKAVGQWLLARAKEGVVPHEIGVFFRSDAQLERARSAVKEAGIPFKVLDDNVETVSGYAAMSTMHLAKGLEFRTVVVMACDDEVIPLQERIQTIGDDADLEEVYATERHLLYVACTRARDHLLVTGVQPASEFLDDLQGDRHPRTGPAGGAIR